MSEPQSEQQFTVSPFMEAILQKNSKLKAEKEKKFQEKEEKKRFHNRWRHNGRIFRDQPTPKPEPKKDNGGDIDSELKWYDRRCKDYIELEEIERMKNFKGYSQQVQDILNQPDINVSDLIKTLPQ